MGDELYDIMNEWRNGAMDDDEAIAHITMGAEAGEIDDDLADELIDLIGD